MRPTPRTNRLAAALSLASALLLVACCTAAHALQARGRAAQATPKNAPAPQKNTPAAQTKKGAANDARKGTTNDARRAEAKARRERMRAVAVLLEVAGGVGEIEDLHQRASVLTYCADALWEADEPSARSLFRRAWEAAAESDDAELKDEQENGRYGDLPERFTRARGLVLELSARRDARTAEPFLRELNEWLARQKSSAAAASENADAAEGPDIGPLNEFTPDGQRLSLAFSLLDEDSYKSAAAVAEPALARGPSGILIEFLLRLRALAPAEADRLYARLLARARASATSDANDVLLLSSYVLTPRLLAVVDGRGSVQFRPLGDVQDGQAGGSAAAARVQARAAFFDTAAAILLRPAQSGAARPGGDAVATYFAAGRLLPFFERESPRHAPAIHARMAALAAEIESARRDSLDAQMKTQKLAGESTSDPLRPRLEALERASDPKTRDQIRLDAVGDAARRKMWERARRLAGEIEDEAARRRASSVIGARQIASLSGAYADEDDDDFEKAAAFARDAEVSPALRAYGLAQAAELAARRGKRERAHALFDEAFGHALQTENGTALRDAAALMAAAVAARIDSPRAWDALAAAVAAVNSDEDFTGEIIWFNLRAPDELSGEDAGLLNEIFHPFSLEEVFAEAAGDDFERASAGARSLKKQVPRSLALIAAAGALIEKTRPARAAGAR